MKSILFTRLSSIILLLIAMLTLDTCATNPVTGKKNLMLVSRDQEQAMGDQSDPQIVAQFGRYDDARLQSFINEKGQAMARVSHMPNQKFEFKILDSPVVNAFALPGGYVYFTRGILAHFNNEAEFAGVLGHEIGHVTARHSARQQSRAVFGQLGLIAGMIISPEFASMGQEAMQAMQLLMLKYGRDAESESDRLGVEYSTKIGYDAKEMAGFFSTLNRLSGGPEGRLPTFLSTHPDPVNREQNVGQLASKWQSKDARTNYKVERDKYLRMIDGIVYGEDPKQGFVENNMFYHPELRFQFPMPNGWNHANSPTQFQMAAPDGKAMMLLTLNSQKELDAAAQEIAQKYKVNVVRANRTTVNGYPAAEILSQQTNPQNNQTINLITYLIQYNGNIYEIHGMALAEVFDRYRNTFQRTQQGFNKLTDADKLNREAERIAVKSVPSTQTLSSYLRSQRIPSDRMEEFAILNNMRLADQVRAGTLIKTLR